MNNRRPGSNKIFARRLRLVLAALAAAGVLGACDGPDIRGMYEEGTSLYDAGDYKGALAVFDEAMDASRGKVSELQYEILKYSAECRLRLGDEEGARAAYESLIELDDSEANKAQYEALLKEFENMDRCREAEKLISQGSYEEAGEMLKDLASLDGTLSGRTAWFDRAVCMEYLRKFDEAAGLWEQYLKVWPDDEEAKKEYLFCSTR